MIFSQFDIWYNLYIITIILPNYINLPFILCFSIVWKILISYTPLDLISSINRQRLAIFNEIERGRKYEISI